MFHTQVHAILYSAIGSVIWTEVFGDSSCNGSIGDIPLTFNRASRYAPGFSGVYLNLDYDSTCNGTVIAWEYCYYYNDMHEDNVEPAEVKVGVWRANGTEYQLVDGSVMTLPTPTLDGGLQFACREWMLNSSQAFQVQEGDIVGIHVNDGSATSIVHILGMTEQNSTTEHVRAENVTDDMTSIANDQLSESQYSLYLMATIGTSRLNIIVIIIRR